MATTLKFTTTVVTEDSIDLMESLELVKALYSRMRGEEKEAPLYVTAEGKAIVFSIEIDMQSADNTVHDPSKAFKAGAEEARPLRPGILSPKQFSPGDLPD